MPTETEARPITLVQRAKAILAGTLPFEPLRLNAPAVEALDRDIAANGVVPTKRARQACIDSLALEEHYAGKGPVLTYSTEEGIVVLAAGDIEVSEVLKGLDDEEAARLEMRWPLDPFVHGLWR